MIARWTFILTPVLLIVGWLAWQARRRAIGRWLPSYVMQWRRWRPVRRGDEVHVLLCIADHFEPRCGGASDELAARRVRAWTDRYPELFDRFRDSDGRPPRHTF